VGLIEEAEQLGREAREAATMARIEAERDSLMPLFALVAIVIAIVSLVIAIHKGDEMLGGSSDAGTDQHLEQTVPSTDP
jgi:hypothetical protein